MEVSASGLVLEGMEAQIRAIAENFQPKGRAKRKIKIAELDIAVDFLNSKRGGTPQRYNMINVFVAALGDYVAFAVCAGFEWEGFVRAVIAGVADSDLVGLALWAMVQRAAVGSFGGLLGRGVLRAKLDKLMDLTG